MAREENWECSLFFPWKRVDIRLQALNHMELLGWLPSREERVTALCSFCSGRVGEGHMTNEWWVEGTLTGTWGLEHWNAIETHCWTLPVEMVAISSQSPRARRPMSKRTVSKKWNVFVLRQEEVQVVYHHRITWFDVTYQEEQSTVNINYNNENVNEQHH